MSQKLVSARYSHIGVNLIKIRLDISVSLRSSPIQLLEIGEERRETEISSLVLIRLYWR